MAHFRYIGEENADTRFHDGALRPIIGAQNIQVMRANREHPEQSQGLSFTYNHAPMLCRWQKKLYLMYLTSPVHEHDGLGRVMLTESGNGFPGLLPASFFRRSRCLRASTGAKGRTVCPRTRKQWRTNAWAFIFPLVVCCWP